VCTYWGKVHPVTPVYPVTPANPYTYNTTPVTPNYGSSTQNNSQSSSYYNAAYYQAQYDKEKRYKEKLEQDLKEYNNPLSPYYSTSTALRLQTQSSIQQAERRMREIQAEARRDGYSIY